MLSSLSRTLTYISALSFLLLGAVLFLAPGWAAGQFAWKVSSFVVMTIGGWCLGNAAFAWQSARLWRWSVVYPSLIYLWLFGLLEGAVLLYFRDKVVLDSPLAIGYVLVIGLSCLTALIGMLDFLRLRPRVDAEQITMQPSVRASLGVFAFLVAVISLSGVFSRPNGFIATGGIFPEILTLFTIYAFAAFFASLSLSALSIFLVGNTASILPYAKGGLALIVPILIAAGFNWEKFNFAAQPGGLLYIGAYVLVMVAALFGFWNASRLGLSKNISI